MEVNFSSPDALAHLLLDGESQQIFLAVQYQADLCLEQLQKSEMYKEIDENKAQSLRRQVKDNLEEASSLRFTINTTDKKLLQEQNTNPVLKQVCKLIVESGNEYTIGNLVDSLGDLTGADHERKPDPLSVVRGLVSESLKHRIGMAWCYDEILEAHRSVLVANMINVAHRLTEVALLLQDSQAIQEVRNMLKSLNLNVPAKVRIPNLQASPAELKKILQDGVDSMQKTHQDIKRLDEQRKEMKKAVKRLNEKLGEDETKNTPTKSSISTNCEPTLPKKTGSGMVFPSLRKRIR